MVSELPPDWAGIMLDSLHASSDLIFKLLNEEDIHPTTPHGLLLCLPDSSFRIWRGNFSSDINKYDPVLVFPWLADTQQDGIILYEHSLPTC